MNLDSLLLELQSELLDLGQYQMQGWLQLRDEQIHKKRDALGEESTFTTYDVESERRLLQFVQSRFPDHSFLGEETGHHKGDPDHYWIVDPIDGTTNFTHSIPFWGPSVGYWYKGRPELGMIRFPALKRTYWARRGGGAFCDGVRLHTRTETKYSMKTIVALHSRAHMQEMVHVRGKLRIPGSIIANMCLLASGDFIACAARGRLWDIAAGVLLMQEAGAVVELQPGIEGLDVPAYAESPEGHKIFQLFTRANAELPSLQKLLQRKTS